MEKVLLKPETVMVAAAASLEEVAAAGSAVTAEKCLLVEMPSLARRL